eukprot:TRINITY_DN10652_c0_g2_i2.p2 TRINITY_DN10652_c0_g2~~TRINITY_DN10652_c0_g2_i2.p2  ORF type:complete len:101 (-),score=6.63 TRINITY_DN10652_c0_g2_i2:360-662(-)
MQDKADYEMRFPDLTRCYYAVVEAAKEREFAAKEEEEKHEAREEVGAVESGEQVNDESREENGGVENEWTPLRLEDIKQAREVDHDSAEFLFYYHRYCDD